MTLIIPPTNLSGAGTTEILGPWGFADTGTHVATGQVQFETFTGTNSTLLVRMYRNSVGAFNGAQVPVANPMAVASAVTTPISTNVDVSAFTPCWLAITVQGNTASVTTWRAWVSILTDLGLASTINTNGCCHDPMLDTILADITTALSDLTSILGSVRKTFPTT